MKFVSRIILCMGFAAFAATASATDVLTGKNGMTLYTFDKDSDGKSACSGGCLALWPAARPGDAAGKEFGEIAREDGTKQLTLEGKPLYYYINDKKPGDVTGDNVKNVWHVVPTKGAKKQSSNSSAYSANSGGLSGSY